MELELTLTLAFAQITFSYGRFSRPVLREFSWAVPRGRTVLLGPNGAGKSTLLALGADAIAPSRGSVTLGGLDRGRRRDRAPYRRAVGWMPQQIRAIPGFTAREQVAYAGWLKGLSRSRAWASAPVALAAAGLERLPNRRASALSGGELRRLGIAQTLIHDAQVLLLDEPSAGLDPAQRARFRELIAALPGDCQVVVSTHEIEDLSELFDTVVVITEGVIRFEGSTSDFLARGDGPRRAERAYASIIGGDG